MAIRVEHRPDQLLQRHAKEGCLPEVEGAYVGEVTYPNHKALLEFLDERVIGRVFANKEELRQVLATWPEFADERNVPYGKEFRAIGISEDAVICPGGVGGVFEIGVIKTVTSPVSYPISSLP